jgi:hypothetical protein
MCAKWVSQVIVSHDVLERMHPALQTAVYSVTESWNAIHTELATCCISFFAVSTI